MNYQINIYNLLIAFCMLQGFIFGSILFFRNKFNHHLKYLGVLVLFFSFYILWVLKFDFGLQEQLPNLQFLPALFIWGIGPAFYIYFKLYLGQSISLKKIYKYFIPLLLEQLYFNMITLIWWSNNWNYSEMNTIEKLLVNSVFSVEHLVGIIIIGFYIIKSFQLIRKKDLHNSINSISFFFYSLFFTYLIWANYSFYDALYFNFNLPPSNFYTFYIILSILLYSISILGFRLNNSKFSLVSITSESIITIKALELANRIESIVEEEELYLNPDLNLNYLSKLLEVTPNKISRTINLVKNQPFRDFINQYRVENFKKRLNSSDLEKHTIISIAYDSGFNSKSSFQRIFKNYEGMTATDYIKKSLDQ